MADQDDVSARATQYPVAGHATNMVSADLEVQHEGGVLESFWRPVKPFCDLATAMQQ
jgi:hypothetical protein